MSLSREKIFKLLQEKPMLLGHLEELDKSLDGMLESATAMIGLMGALVGLDKKDLARIRDEEIAGFRPDPKLVQLEADLHKYQTPASQATQIEENRIGVFPHIIDFHIQGFLKERMKKEGIESATRLLTAINEHGVSIVWDAIHINVERDTKRLCGTIFPDELIAEGRTLILDLRALTADFARACAHMQHGSDVKSHLESREAPRKAQDSRPPVARTEAPYLSGLRRGFLNSKPSAVPSPKVSAEASHPGADLSSMA